MTHEEMQELAVGYALYALEPDDERVVRDHLPGCAECTQLVADTHEVAAVFSEEPTGDDYAAELAGSGLRDRIVAAAVAEPRAQQRPAAAAEPDRGPVAPPVLPALPEVDRSRPVTREVGEPARRRSRQAMRRGRLLVGALAAAVAVAIAVPVTLAASGGSSGSGNPTLAQALLEPGAREVTLTGTAGANAKAVVSSKGVIFFASGLKDNDRSNSTYVLWAGDDFGVRPIATFDASSGKTVQVLADERATGSGKVALVAVSLEPGRSAPKAPSDVVLTGRPA